MTRLLRHITDFLLFSNLWVALCLSVLVLGVARHYFITDCFRFATFAFLGTFATYNFHRLVRNIQFEKLRLVTERIKWQNRNRTILLLFSLLSVITALVIFFYLPIKPFSVLLLVISGIIIFFYAVPIPGGRKMLRSIPFIKNALILTVWIVLICIPLLNREKHIDIAEIVAVAMIIFAQIIPFDVRDLPFDAAEMKTIPQILGVPGSKILAVALTLSATTILMLVNPFHWSIFPALGCSIIGCLLNVSSVNSTSLEFAWDGSLMLLGVYFYLV